MARAYSKMIPLGHAAHAFQLIDPIDNKIKKLDQLKGENGTVIMFICNHCPFVVHITEKLCNLADSYKNKGINFIGINSNDVENYPDDHPNKMKDWAEKNKISFTYLFDETQDIAKIYEAQCTPDFYVYNHHLELVYRGRFDSSTPGNDILVTGEDLENALTNLLEGNEPIKDQKQSVGCSIKWK